MLMRRDAHPRRSRAITIAEQQAHENERNHIEYLKNAESELGKRNYTMQDAIKAIDQNSQMISYMREKKLIDEKGNVIT